MSFIETPKSEVNDTEHDMLPHVVVPAELGQRKLDPEEYRVGSRFGSGSSNPISIDNNEQLSHACSLVCTIPNLSPRQITQISIRQSCTIHYSTMIHNIRQIVRTSRNGDHILHFTL